MAQRSRNGIAARFATLTKSDVQRRIELCLCLSGLRGRGVATRLRRLDLGEVLNGPRDRLDERFPCGGAGQREKQQSSLQAAKQWTPPWRNSPNIYYQMRLGAPLLRRTSA